MSGKGKSSDCHLGYESGYEGYLNLEWRDDIRNILCRSGPAQEAHKLQSDDNYTVREGKEIKA